MGHYTLFAIAGHTPRAPLTALDGVCAEPPAKDQAYGVLIGPPWTLGAGDVAWPLRRSATSTAACGQPSCGRARRCRVLSHGNLGRGRSPRGAHRSWSRGPGPREPWLWGSWLCGPELCGPELCGPEPWGPEPWRPETWGPGPWGVRHGGRCRQTARRGLRHDHGELERLHRIGGTHPIGADARGDCGPSRERYEI
jgi:hypothetical protein